MSGPPRAADIETVELPAPTAWPIVTAFGLTLAFAGIVTTPFISFAGVVVVIAGAAGWWRDVLPAERHERVPLLPPERRARPVEPMPGTVDHLVVGAEGHRLRLPVKVTPFAAGIPAGAVGGVAMAIVACAFGVLRFGSPWYPINLLSAAALPSLASASVEHLKEFSLAGLAVGIGIHGALSMLVGVLYAAILPMLPERSVLWGGIAGPLIWTGLVWASLGVVNPALQERVSWPWFVVSQVAFGITAGVVVARAEKVRTIQSLPLAVRAGIEAPGVPDRPAEDGAEDRR